MSALGRALARIAELPARVAAALPGAAARIEAKLRADATSKRGRVPAIHVTASADAITVTASARVHAKARENGEPDAWRAIVREAVGDAVRGA